jgi:hypothetical protein
MFFAMLMMGMFMPNLSVHQMNALLGLFGFLRPLSLTKEDPLKNDDLKTRLDLLQGYASGAGQWIIDSGATNHMS